MGSFGPAPHKPEMLPREYSREALKRGLAYEARLGANPFKFGMIGATDMHIGLATTTEDNFFGKVAMLEPTADPIRFDEAIVGRVQVIKGWTDAAGKTHEMVYDVAWSGDRKPLGDGKLPPVGNTVNVQEATYTNSIGAPYLSAYWKDPSFDPKQRAFYYVRVLEIPTPRWTTYDAKVFGVKLPTDVPATLQERAYSSPSWYTPG